MDKSDDLAPFMKDQFLNPAICSLELLRCTINDLQDYYQLDQGSFRLYFSDFDLKELIQHCVSLFSSQAKGKFIDLELFFDEKIDSMYNFHNDPERIK